MAKKYLFFRASDSAPIYGPSSGSIRSTGTYGIDPSVDRKTITIIDRLNQDKVIDLNWPITDYLKENGQPYANYTELDGAMTGFFSGGVAINVTGGLTDTQLRENPVTVSPVPANVGVCDGCVAAALSDTVDLAHPGYIQPRLLAGNVKVTDVNGNDSTLAFDLKEISAFRVKRVWLTGTTADMGIVVIY